MEALVGAHAEGESPLDFETTLNSRIENLQPSASIVVHPGCQSAERRGALLLSEVRLSDPSCVVGLHLGEPLDEFVEPAEVYLVPIGRDDLFSKRGLSVVFGSIKALLELR
jgi:hypothetical protein